MKHPPRNLAYGVVLLATALVLVARWLFFDALVGPQFPFVLFTIPVVAGAWVGGLKPGLLAVALGLATGIYLYTERQGPILIDALDWVRVAMFVMVGGIVSTLGEMMHVARQRLAVRQEQLETREQQLEIEQQRRQGLESALGEREERFHMAVESAGIGTWDLNVLTGERTWSDRTLVMFGIGPEVNISQLDFAQLLHPDDRDSFRRSVREALDPAGDGVYRNEYRACRPDGTIRWVVAHGQAYFQGAGKARRAVRFIGTVLDITERKELEESLYEASRRKDLFLATLAHELRNPLAPITNALDTWPLVAGDRAKTQRLRETMNRQVQQLTRLTDDLLDVSRATRGMITLHRQRIDLARLVATVCEEKAPLVGAGGRKLVCDLPSEEIFVDGDSVRLTQVLENLLDNAQKFTDPGGTIRVTLSRHAATATLAVKDNGVGIPKESIGEVFELFRQLDNAAGRSRAGLGIGLHLVQQIAELHGGRATARSDGEGRGSEFVVELPLADATASEVPMTAAPTSSTELPGDRCKVLVVDDLPEVAASLATLLEVIGHEVLVAHDGPSAIEAVMADRPDLVILDIAMPQMNGYEIARALRSRTDTRGLVLVALTGRDQPQDLRLSIEAGFDHHLTKPATLAELNSVLRRCGRGQAALDTERQTGVIV